MRSVELLAAAVILSAAACGSDTSGDDVVDTAPDTRFEATPSGDLATVDTSPFALGCDATACTYECSLDGAAFAPCESAIALTHLAAGAHTFAARAIDAAGNVDATPATHAWSLAFAWREVAGGAQAMCAIAGDGGLYCWGRAYAGELGNGVDEDQAVSRPTRVGTATDWSALTAGRETFCARRPDGTYCWGANWDGQLGDPAVADHLLVPTRVAPAFATLAQGGDHACGLATDGALSCWGYNSDGQLGDGTMTSQPRPTRVGTGAWRAASAGDYHTCAIDSTGALFCWGGNFDGQSGQDPMLDRLLTPTQVGTASDWLDVSAAYSHTCGLREGGALWCWGGNWSGQLGTGDTVDSATPVQVAGSWRAVRTFSTGTCAIATSGQVSCWGDNLRAQLGSIDAFDAYASAPQPISSTAPFTALAGKNDLRCALGARDILCWGDNRFADGGLGRGIPGNEPQVVDVDTGWQRLAVGNTGGCGLRKDGTLACWGLGFFVGQALPLSYTPRAVSPATDWTALDVTTDANLDDGHACGIRGGKVYCWGHGNEGQLGDGAAQLRTQPVAVAGSDYTAVSTGAYSTCAITSIGSLYCWGGGTNNYPVALPNYGQVGDGTQLQRNAPVQITVPAASGWVQVSVSGQRASALRSDGSLWGWGINTNGAAALVPTRIGTDSDWAEVLTTPNGVTCARKVSGAFYCSSLVYDPAWARPMIQVGTATDHTAIVRFDGGVCTLRGAGELHCYWGTTDGWTDNFPSYDVNGNIPGPSGTWASFDGGYGFRCGVRADGTRACAGARFAGSFGDGVDERQPTAVLAP
ncbi:MAG: hypothetical protein K8W52_34755 [Deltaproteobacteria bacterium]|nr:hypothetical protein [Deltaproteobacteria bacterium]